MVPSSNALYNLKVDLSKHGQILRVEISPYILSQDLILIAFHNTIILGHLTIVEPQMQFNILAEFTHTSRCSDLSFSPETSISILPNLVLFATAGDDHNLRVFKSDLKGDNSCQVFSGHTMDINEIQYDYDNNFLVSVSDDNSAKLWETEDFKCVVTFRLTSPGMSAVWHKENSSKLLVAEKIGLIRFYNVEKQTPILSLDYNKTLFGSHWSPTDQQLVASLQLGELIIWNTAKPCVPVSSNLLFSEAGGSLRFSPFGELITVVNQLDSSLKVIQTNTNKIKLTIPVILPTNISWHCRSPLFCVGDYMNLIFWRITSS